MGWWNLLVWHRTMHRHPIFDPDYARENLVSFGQTVLALGYFFVLGSFLIELLYNYHLLDNESILYAIFSSSINNFLFSFNNSEMFNTITTIIIYLMLGLIGRELIEIYKASLHPKDK